MAREGAPNDLAAWLSIGKAWQPSVTADGLTVVHLDDEAGVPTAAAVPLAGGAPRRIATGLGRVGLAQAAPVGSALLLAADAQGNERWQLYVTDLAGRASPARPLVDRPEVIHTPGVWSQDGTRYRFASNARDRRWFDVEEVEVATGRLRTMLEADSTHLVRAARGDRTLVARQRSNLDVDLLLLDGDRTVHLNPHEGEQFVGGAALREDAVYAAANPGRELAALVRFRLSGAGHEFLATYPGELEIVEAAPEGPLLALVVNRDGWSETHLFDVTTREDRLLNSGPRGVISAISWAPDGSAFAYDLSCVDGCSIYRRTVATGKEKRLTGRLDATPRVTPPPKLATLKAQDGVPIPYWEMAGPAPRGTLLWIHGGPEGQSRPSFAPIAQYLVTDGWRVVMPNIRGSTGYGRRFVHLDDGPLRPNSIRDVRDLAEHLVRTGRAVRGRIGIVGGSYGGFVVLSALADYPEWFGAGVDLVGMSNLETFLEKTGPWRRRLREAEYGRLNEDREMLRALSPIHRADRIRAPLLVIHGRNDPRVPVEEAEQIAGRLKDAGRTVELLIFDDEGHGIVRRENQLTAWGRAVEFLGTHLRGPAPTA